MTLTTNHKMLGIVLICGSYLMYSTHYATMKWLDVGYSLSQLIFIRSALMIVMTLAKRPSAFKEVMASPYKRDTALRSLLQVGSTYCFFLAASQMQLGLVATLYATAPLIIVVVSFAFLGETVGGISWLALFVGMVGTIIAANPTGEVSLVPTLYALGSGFFWALTVIFTRKSGARESTAAQLLTTGVVFCAVTALLMDWKTPDNLFDTGLLLALGIEILLAQMFFFEAYRYAPASLLAPLEYSSVVWSCILGFAIFGDLPTQNVVWAALLIIGGGLILATSEMRGMKPSVAAVAAGE